MKDINKGILTKKIGMTQLFGEQGEVTPVTVLQAFENTVVQVKTPEKDGYSAVKVGLIETKEDKVKKPIKGQAKEVSKAYKKFVELRLKNSAELKVGDSIKVDQFEENEKVVVTGISKGRGFTGTVKQYNFAIGPMTHGSKSHRRQGTIGAGTGQSKVWRGQKMPGRYGAEKVSVKNVSIAKIMADENLILVQGSVPGATGGIVKIYK